MSRGSGRRVAKVKRLADYSCGTATDLHRVPGC